MTSRRGAALGWSSVSDLGCNPPGCEILRDHESARGLGRPMVVVDLSAVATTIHHVHEFRAERPTRSPAGGAPGWPSYPLGVGGSTSRYSKKPRPRPRARIAAKSALLQPASRMDMQTGQSLASSRWVGIAKYV